MDQSQLISSAPVPPNIHFPRYPFVVLPAPASRDKMNNVADASVSSYGKRGTWSPPQGNIQYSAQYLISPIASMPQNRASPASIAFMTTKSDCQRKPSVLEWYTQGATSLSASCQSVQKRCLFSDCTKMAVSKGLCRGHGGGRRCHFVGGCTKSAQSRSMFCWAHGGGQRCELNGCKRSRKTRRYCVAHKHLEIDKHDYSYRSASWEHSHTRQGRYVQVYKHSYPQPTRRLLPSLGHALYAASLSLPRLPQIRSRMHVQDA